MMWPYLLVLGFILLFLLFQPRTRSSAPLPPSPPTSPFLGCMRWLRKGPIVEAIEAFRSEFRGPCPLLYIPLPNRKMIFVNDADLVRKLFVDMANDTSDRPFVPIFALGNPRRLGIVSAPRHRWTANRRFSLRVLRDFGLGKARIIDRLLEVELANLRALLDRANGAPLAPSQLCNRAVGGVICSLLFGSNLAEEGDWLDNLLRDSNTYFAHRYLFITFFSFLAYLYDYEFLWRFLPDREGLESVRRIKTFMKKSVMEVRGQMERQGVPHEPSNFVEAFLTNSDSPSEAENAEDDAARLLVEFFVAGVDTTSTTLQWAMTLLCLHPELQDRAHKEVITLLGPHGIVLNRHTNELPFCKALVHEVLRFACIAPASIPHTVPRDIEIEVSPGQRFLLPKGCYLLANIFALLRRPDYWPKPLDFDPVANFMDEEGSSYLLRHPDAFLPFSSGRRACLGESLARNELFVFLTSLLQSHRLRLAEPYASWSREDLLRPSDSVVRGLPGVLVQFERRE